MPVIFPGVISNSAPFTHRSILVGSYKITLTAAIQAGGNAFPKVLWQEDGISEVP